MAVTQELRTMFTADTTPLSKALNGIRKSAFMPVMVGAGLAAGATLAWYAASKRTVTTLDNLAKGAQRAGLSGAEFQRYALAAQLAGTDVAALEAATKRMHRVILDSERGMKTAVDSLSELGLTYEDLKGRSPDQQLRMMMEGLAGVEDTSRRAAIAQEVFGRSGTALLPMLNKGVGAFRALMEEREKIGPLFTDAQLASGEEMLDTITRNKEAFKLMIDQLVIEGFPALMEGLKAITELMRIVHENMELIKGTATAIGWLNPGKWIGEGMMAGFETVANVRQGTGLVAGDERVQFRRQARAQFLASGQRETAASMSMMSDAEVRAALKQIAVNTSTLPQMAN